MCAQRRARRAERFGIVCVSSGERRVWWRVVVGLRNVRCNMECAARCFWKRPVAPGNGACMCKDDAVCLRLGGASGRARPIGPRMLSQTTQLPRDLRASIQIALILQDARQSLAQRKQLVCQCCWARRMHVHRLGIAGRARSVDARLTCCEQRPFAGWCVFSPTHLVVMRD